MKKAALFFDIDGTLLSEINGEIPESAMESLREARRNGHKIFINTGRTICNIPPVLRRMEFDGYLCGCGTYILAGDEILFFSSISYEDGIQYIDKAIECNIEGFYEGVDDIYLPARVSRFERLESSRRYFGMRGLGLETSIENKNFIYDKILIYTDEQSKKEEFFEFITPKLEAIDRGSGVYECIQSGYSKATAIEYMLNELGMEKDQAYVFGDSSNDLSMFQYADHAVALGAHDEVLDPYTEFVTKTVEEDGIKHALKYYRLIG